MEFQENSCRENQDYMKKSVIENFLNLPEMVGLALLDRQSCSYVYGTERFLNLQQRDTITQGIQQIISTTPADLKTFDFRFSQESVRVYKLASDLTLLILTSKNIDTQAYQTAITQMGKAFQEDLEDTLVTLRALVEQQELFPEGRSSGVQTLLAPDLVEAKESISLSAPSLSATSEITYQWEEGIAALNVLTDATAKYLGQIVVANTWRITRPDGPVLEPLQCDREGHFSYLLDAQGQTPTISPEEYETLNQWIHAFVKRCSLIIRDYPEMVLQQALNDEQRTILRIEIV